MVKLAVINLTSVSVTATLCNPQDLSFFSQTHPFQQGVAYPCGVGSVDAESEHHDHRQGIDFCIIAVVQLDAPFHLARLQHSAFAHGTDGGTECRGGYTEQPYQLHFVHPHAGGIGRHGNPAAPSIVIVVRFIGCASNGETSAYLALKGGYVVFKFSVGHFRVNLRGGYVRMP